MRSLYRLAALAGVAVMCISGMARAEAPEKISLSILYAGKPESARANDFARFLREHFTKVEVMDAAKFDPAQTAGCDVVILDYDSAAKLKLPPDYSKPTLLQGVNGAHVGSSLGLRLGYS
ncbi:MAG: hypothetical protein ABSA67_19430 [Candidatus Brocadiia bacterium]|jgi:hypothetical protein